MKKILSLVLALAMVLCLVACGSKEAPETTAAPNAESKAPEAETTAPEAELIPVGLTFGDLANPVWADCANWLAEHGPEYGLEVSIVGCETSAEQIEQIENFLTAGAKAIVVGAKDTDSMGEFMKDPIEDGTVVFALGYAISNFTAEMMVENYQVGYDVGAMGAEFIKEKFGDEPVEVLVQDAPEYDVLVERANGINDALKELAPNATVVNVISGTTTNELMPQAENAFTANPNAKVCICIGDGGALAFKEAATGANLAADDFGIFCVDCTEAVASDMFNGGLIRGAVSLGGGAFHGQVIAETLQKIFAGEEYERSVPYPETKVTIENVEEVAAGLGYNLSK